MGEVVSGHFGTTAPEPVAQISRRDTAPAAPIVLDDYTAERIFLDAMFMSENIEAVEGARFCLEEASACIFVCNEIAEDDRRVMMHRRAMRTCALEAICEQALRSRRPQWVADPPYYGALVLEYGARIHEIELICTTRGSML
jgi:hypothetical protein